jgi:hypothetical protein
MTTMATIVGLHSTTSITATAATIDDERDVVGGGER